MLTLLQRTSFNKVNITHTEIIIDNSAGHYIVKYNYSKKNILYTMSCKYRA